ncbi:hypothetical protein FISHEDRAFT_11170, partial [Fistulina hepatica ATCC 64428]
EYIVDHSTATVDHAMSLSLAHCSQSTPRFVKSSFINFVVNVVDRSHVSINVILGALVYIVRSKAHLRIRVIDWAHERVFLGALVVAAKYLNDSSPKNAYWAWYTGVFTKRDVGLVEREFLDVLDFDLKIKWDDLKPHWEAVTALLNPS